MNYKIVLIAVIVALATGGAFYGLSMSGTQTSSNPASNEYGVKEQQYIEEEKAKLAALEEEYKNDPYGGSTPEETLQLYIEALEKGDIEMAVNLFAAEDRDDARNRFLNARYMSEYIRHLKMEVRAVPSASGLDEISLEFFDQDGQQKHAEDFKLNPFTGNWKIQKVNHESN